ncbi:glycosyltransferase family 2 protein [Haloechinothrix halophila]|uniref:glycosyltransferase family 2 protein n=1 Tax=Haloechinothrix halophila TaxID=1069073 RepID=UPI00042A50DB|nr:glycosyltransferase family 2 protein [Haloechinothrix halophila]
MQTAPVVAVVVCHDGEAWLPTVLSALRRSTVRPQCVVAVDTGSTDRTPELLDYALSGQDAIVDSILTMRADTGFAEAVAAGVQHATVSFDERHTWVWVLHDDSAPEPDCLTDLLHAADAAPSAGVLGPLAVDWLDTRLIAEAGLSTDASGHRHDGMGIDAAELAEQSSEVLAMPSAGVLIKRTLWDQLGGFDEDFPLLREDIDFGWRANVAGVTVLCVPRARIRHARALRRGERGVGAIPGAASDRAKAHAADRIGGVHTLLVNCSTPSFLLGVPRLVVLCVLRAIGFVLARDLVRARAELAAVGFMLRGGQLLPGRRLRVEVRHRAGTGDGRTGRYRHRAGVRGLFVSRTMRLRFAVRSAVRSLIRRRIASEAALGRLPESATTRATWIPPEELRAAAFAGGEPKDVVAVPLAGPRRSTASALVRGEAATAAGSRDVAAAAGNAEVAPAADGAEVADTTDVEQPQRPRPGDDAHGGLVFVEVNRARVLAATLFAPPLLLVLGLTGLALLVNGHRLGLDLAGGRLLPIGELSQVWSSYLAGWHPEGGGTSAQAPPALAIVGALGALLYPIGGASAAVALLLLLDIPLAALSGYAASGRLGVHRWVRALLATGYALLPPATAAVAQGRIDVVVVHILLPLVLAGIAAVLRPRSGGQRWLSVAVAVSLGLAVIGSFSPLTHVLALVVLLGGFVFVSSSVPIGRRLAGIALVALLPIALTLPWPAALVTNPALVLHGLGARVPGIDADVAELLSLYPGGAGGLPIGGVLVAAAFAAVVVRPTTRVLPGVGLVLIGAAGVALVRLVPVAPVAGGDVRPGWAGAPLLLVAAGLLAVVLGVVRRDARDGGTTSENDSASNGNRPLLARRFAVGAGVAALVVFAVAAVTTAEEGPLRDAEPGRLAAPLAAELADSGRTVLVLYGDGQPRISGDDMPAFGDDSLDLPDGTPERLAGWQRTLLGGQNGGVDEVRDVLASASAAGVQFVVLPDGVTPDQLLDAGDGLVAETVPLADGRQVLRLLPANGPVMLIAPSLSKLAIGGKAPPGDVDGEGTAVVEAELPDVRVRVSDGPAGRLLVLAANLEPGWEASVNGEQVPIVPAWGHQVGVEVPTRAADVVVRNQATMRTLLLLVQVGALLFTLLTAIPSRRPRTPHGPSITSGSTPR